MVISPKYHLRTKGFSIIHMWLHFLRKHIMIWTHVMIISLNYHLITKGFSIMHTWLHFWRMNIMDYYYYYMVINSCVIQVDNTLWKCGMSKYNNSVKQVHKPEQYLRRGMQCEGFRNLFFWHWNILSLEKVI